MTYEELIETISIIVENEKIAKKGLSLHYTLNEKNYKQLNEHLFYKANPANVVLVPADSFDVEVDGILINFTKEKIEQVA